MNKARKDMKKKHSEKSIEKKSKEEQIEIYKQQLKDQEKHKGELTESIQRLQAEFENYKKRTEKQNQEFIKFANKELILTILPLLDNFELALKNTENKDEFVKGMKLIYTQLIILLEEQGLKSIETKGKIFDPYLHEALMQGKDKTQQDNIILEEFQKGYTLNNQVIRPSKVKVNKRG